MTGPALDSSLAASQNNAAVSNRSSDSLLLVSADKPLSYGAITAAQSAAQSWNTQAPAPFGLDSRSKRPIAPSDINTESAKTQIVSDLSQRKNYDFDTARHADLDTDVNAASSSSTSSSSSFASSDPGPVSDMPPQTALLKVSHRRLAIAYAGLFLVAFSTSLEAQVTAPLAAFAVSSFSNHSLLSTVVVVQGVVNAVIKPPMAKMADVFGRFEAYVGAVLLCVAGYIQMACSRNVQTFAAAQILYSAGITGLQVLNQIFVADTSDLRHRALFSSLPDTPFLVTVWIGPSIAGAILSHTSWRWGYAMWAIILPAAFFPLGGSLAISAYQSHSHRRQRRRSSCLGLTRPKSSSSDNNSGNDEEGFPGRSWARSHHTSGNGGSSSNNNDNSNLGRRLVHKSSILSIKETEAYSTFRQLLIDLDVVGILILSASMAMILLPLTLAEKAESGWGNPYILSSIVVGLLLLIFAFPAWEARPDWVPHPLIPPTLLRSITFCAGCGIAFFYFAVFYLSVQPYFYSYLLVAHNQSVAAAGRITQIFSFTSTIAAVSASVAIRHLRRYKVFVVSGACVYLLGVSLMLVYRTADAGTGRLIATQVGVGVGAGLMSVPTQIGIQASVTSTPRLVAAATAVYLTIGEAGIAVGAAISGALWGRLVPAKLDLYLPETARQNASAIYSSVVVATSYPWGSPERLAIIRAYQESMTTLLTVAVAFCVPVLVLALLMEDLRFDTASPTLPSTYADGGDADSEGGDEEEQEGFFQDSSRLHAHAFAEHPGAPSSSSAMAVKDSAAGERTNLLLSTDED
ncbi:hypothetical protein SEPCBS57363_001616 [Sporothrix epigloea]|uniref:Major facilitator superfamily (MFS) profile domain-containing protein n=1 Tax=Sporothrix epigloea TaxID=1892477 RepID=A0ABP0DBA9_9PEZI